jgi:hypothetical protein
MIGKDKTEERLILLDLSVAYAIATHDCGYQKEFYQEVEEDVTTQDS